MKTAQIIEADTLISTERVEKRRIVGIAKSAPCWFKDAVNERINAGQSLKFAVTSLTESPFFKDEWVIYE